MSYEQLLDKAFEKIQKKEFADRFKVPTLILETQGSKTIIKNFSEILSAIRAIQKDYTKVDENMSVLQKHLNNAYNMMGSVADSFANLGRRISSTGKLEEKEKTKLPS